MGWGVGGQRVRVGRRDMQYLVQPERLETVSVLKRRQGGHARGIGRPQQHVIAEVEDASLHFPAQTEPLKDVNDSKKVYLTSIHLQRRVVVSWGQVCSGSIYIGIYPRALESRAPWFEPVSGHRRVGEDALSTQMSNFDFALLSSHLGGEAVDAYE